VIELGLSRLFSIVVSYFSLPKIDVLRRTGASNGRGPRCANWMQDYIDDVSKFGRKTSLQVLILKGGIKGWVKDFEGSLMEGFEEKYWEQFK
jgi:hypothetical protein